MCPIDMPAVMTRSGSPSLYDDDFFAWTQDQATALREIAPTTAGRVDIANVATEIEDLGQRDLREVTSFLTRLMEHLIKINCHDGSLDRAHWISECHFQTSASDAYTPSMALLIDVEKLWERAGRLARRSMREMGVATMPLGPLPFSLDELVTDNFDLDAALTKIGRS